MATKTSITDTRFTASSRLPGNYPHSSPVFFILDAPLSEYRKNAELVDECITEIEANSLYSSLELVVEKLNKLLSKNAIKDWLSIALFQKEGGRMKVAAFPKCVMSFQPRVEDGHVRPLQTMKLSFADTNRIFSEILEIDVTLSPRLIFSFSEDRDPRPPLLQIVENRISSQLPKKELKLPKFIRSFIAKKMRSAQRHPKPEAHHKSPIKNSIKYGVALLVAVLAIVVINNASSNKFNQNKKSSNQTWVGVVNADVSPIVDVKEKLPSKFIHEPNGLVKAGNYFYTFQNEPNIILQIDKTVEVKPIVIDSEKVGKLTGMKKISDELLIFTHDKKGLIFLSPGEQRWRLVEFAKPSISEYTDIDVYNGYIYVLDARARQIWKLSITESELTGVPWVRDSRIDLSLASGMAIDGSIYLSLITGEVVKMTRGVKDSDFAVSKDLSPTLSNVDAVLFDGSINNLLVLDRVENRIVYLQPDGKFVKQIKNPLPLPFDSLTTEQGRLYGIVQSDIVEIAEKSITLPN